MINVLFVCLGNICRSPMAEAVFQHMVNEAGLSDQFAIDAVGTGGYHVGEPAHRGTQKVLAKHNIPCHSISRKINRNDLAQSDYIIAMDHSNRADVLSMARPSVIDDKVELLLSFADDTSLSNVPDPYYTGSFDEVYRLVESGCAGLLVHIRAERGL